MLTNSHPFVYLLFIYSLLPIPTSKIMIMKYNGRKSNSEEFVAMCTTSSQEIFIDPNKPIPYLGDRLT